MNPIDAMIAAVGLVHDLTLVTNNVRHFDCAPGLRIENWLA
jgi:predicted nucleic acid-binding protein